MPTMAPTNAFTTTSSENCPRFSRIPRRRSFMRTSFSTPFGASRASSQVSVLARPTRRLLRGARRDTEPSSAELRHAELEPVSHEPSFAQEGHGVDGHDAVRTAAIRHHVAALGQLVETCVELRHRDRERSGDMARPVLFCRAHVDHRDLARADPPQELLVADALEGRAPLEVGTGHVLDLAEARFGEAPEREEDTAHLDVGQPVLDVEALFLGLHEASGA
jgi:hypothetical protein